MQEELKALQKQLGITFVFVTHDQGEALSMADRVAVFNDGRIVQVGTPEEIYERPQIALRRRFRRLLECAAAGLRRRSWRSGEWASLRPEKIASSRRARRSAEAQSHADGEIELISYQGAVTRFSVAAGDMRITAAVPATEASFEPGRQGAADLAQIGHGTMEDGA